MTIKLRQTVLLWINLFWTGSYQNMPVTATVQKENIHLICKIWHYQVIENNKTPVPLWWRKSLHCTVVFFQAGPVSGFQKNRGKIRQQRRTLQKYGAHFERHEKVQLYQAKSRFVWVRRLSPLRSHSSCSKLCRSVESWFYFCDPLI